MAGRRLKLFLASDVGLVRNRNEDIAAAGRTFVRNSTKSLEVVIGEAPYVIGVADGVGGGAAGDFASRQVLEHLIEELGALDRDLSNDRIGQLAREKSQEAHDDLLRQGMLHPDRSGMATTATVVLFYDGARYLVHAGDSRLYVFEAGTLRRVSRDHTLREFSGDPRIPGNILVNCYGAEQDFFVDFQQLGDDFDDGGTYLLCSDGLSDMVPEESLATTLSESSSLEEAGKSMVEQARAGGGTDNITLVLARFA